jgi:hypothetical protein
VIFVIYPASPPYATSCFRLLLATISSRCFVDITQISKNVTPFSLLDPVRELCQGEKEDRVGQQGHGRTKRWSTGLLSLRSELGIMGQE